MEGDPTLFKNKRHAALMAVIEHAKVGVTLACLARLLYPIYSSTLQAVREYVTTDEKLAFIVLFMGVRSSMYWGINSMLHLWDARGMMQQYKLDRPPRTRIPAGLLTRLLVEAAISQFVVMPIYLYYHGFDFFKACGLPALDAPLPTSFVDIVAQFAFAHAFNEYLFYFAHRILHWPIFYGMIHKKHHEFKGTIGFAAEYAHPVEQLLANIIPSVGGMVFFGRHNMMLLMWLCARVLSTYEHHSGFQFKWGPFGMYEREGASFHDHHHVVNIGNYGAPYIDFIFGTMDTWKATGGQPAYIARVHTQGKTNIRGEVKRGEGGKKAM